ncbi:hypothetical protein Trydic_g8074 [Trypoxylus dichotomus]
MPLLNILIYIVSYSSFCRKDTTSYKTYINHPAGKKGDVLRIFTNDKNIQLKFGSKQVQINFCDAVLFERNDQDSNAPSSSPASSERP